MNSSSKACLYKPQLCCGGENGANLPKNIFVIGAAGFSQLDQIFVIGIGGFLNPVYVFIIKI